jgi:hypothetical protein
MRDIETVNSELRLVAALRLAARERGGPLLPIAVVDALLDERRELNRVRYPVLSTTVAPGAFVLMDSIPFSAGSARCPSPGSGPRRASHISGRIISMVDQPVGGGLTVAG